MFVEYIWREKNSASLDGCVLTSLKHRVNFYMLPVIDFPTGCGKKLRKRDRKESRDAEPNEVIFQLCQIAAQLRNLSHCVTRYYFDHVE